MCVCVCVCVGVCTTISVKFLKNMKYINVKKAHICMSKRMEPH